MGCTLHSSAFLAQFSCLGDQCEDTCCKGWGMQLSAQTVEKYQREAPELMDAVTSGEAEHIMKRDPATDYCVKFEAGWCGVHAKYGTDFLGDACHFFPRTTRGLGDAAVMTASLSCPEVVRLALLQDGGFSHEQSEAARLPHSLKNYAPEGLDEATCLNIHRAFIDAALDEQAAPEMVMARLRSVAASLQSVDIKSWGMAAPFYLKHADARLPQPEAQIADPFNLLNALQGLIGASRKTSRPRLEWTLRDIEQALHVTLDWERLSIATSEQSLAAWQAMQARWQAEWAAHFAPMLRRWIAAQLAVALFPFGGFGDTLTDRATLLGVRFATLKLALMSACQMKGGLIADADVVRVVQSLARFLDHLADPALSMQIYSETGWVREPRLRALVG